MSNPEVTCGVTKVPYTTKFTGYYYFVYPGLMSGWYDACTGWMATVGRMQVMDFSMPFNKPTKVFFFILQGKSFDVNNIQNVKAIGE